MSKSDLTADRLRDVLSYDPATGVFRWRVKISKKVVVGKRTGATIGSQGYRRIRINNRTYKAARLAWLHMTGQWPTCVIDHINGNRSDDRFDNLRDVPVMGNVQNQRKATIRNKSAKKLGVSWHILGKCWRARIRANGVEILLGHFKTIEEAHSAYVTAKRKLHSTCTI